MAIDMWDFMTDVAETFEQCETEEQMDVMEKKMIEFIKNQKEMSKQYLQLGIL